MTSKIDAMQKELDGLVEKGQYLYYSITENTRGLAEDIKESLKENKIKLPDFYKEYDTWYSESLVVIKQLLPDRLADFIRQYKDEKRKEINRSTYCISDYLQSITPGLKNESIPRMYNQYTILTAAQKCFKSALFDLQGVLEADVFDYELSTAEELAKKGFLRASGVIAGVIMEKHLGHICGKHNLKIKKNPTIADCLQPLKDNNIIDTPTWRLIQYLADVRNLCGHNKDREPTKEEVLDLIKGTEKVIKTVW